MTAYYNEHDRFNVEWLKHLMAANLIAPGEIDGRDIQDVRAEELRGFTQCHFFAGIGVWSYSLRLAGWTDDRPVWTGSCPCPTFSCAGKGDGFNDPRHLWPAWEGLASERKPPTIFGEQSDDAIGFGWLDLVQTDLERAGYAVAKAVFGACSIGAPHERKRLYFCAKSDSDGSLARGEAGAAMGYRSSTHSSSGAFLRSQSISARLERFSGDVREWRGPGWLDPIAARSIATSGATRGFWRDCDWWHGRDGKFRPIGDRLFPLAHGIAKRVGKLRGYGNALVAPQAEGFIRAYMEAYGIE